MFYIDVYDRVRFKLYRKRVYTKVSLQLSDNNGYGMSYDYILEYPYL